MTQKNQIIIISGRSGSGKSTALHVLEDAGFYAIDNLPGSLFPDLLGEIINQQYDAYKKVVISFDARNTTMSFEHLIESIHQLPESIQTQIIFLDSQSNTLIKRFSETRRKHPLSKANISLQDAIELEKNRLAPFRNNANLVIDTSNTSVMQLREIVRKRICDQDAGEQTSVLFKSFGFKHGVPIDADIVFDVRCLPNPYWILELRDHTGLDEPIIEYLSQERDVNDMFHDISTYIDRWIPKLSENQRSYITVAIGCTGGVHRSVYLCERLKNWYSVKHDNVQIHHRELSSQGRV